MFDFTKFIKKTVVKYSLLYLYIVQNYGTMKLWLTVKKMSYYTENFKFLIYYGEYYGSCIIPKTMDFFKTTITMDLEFIRENNGAFQKKNPMVYLMLL